jgi:hypothetical protein
MDEDSLLQIFLNLGDDYPLSLVDLEVNKHNPASNSKTLFDLFFPDKSNADFIAWRAHRQFNSWNDDIYWMTNAEFHNQWPMFASALKAIAPESEK